MRTVGVEPAGAPRYTRSRAEGRPVQLESVQTIADGTRTDHANPDNFAVIQARVDELYTVEGPLDRGGHAPSDDHRQGGGRAPPPPSPWPPPCAARSPSGRRDKAVFVLSGGNADPALLARLLA